MKCKMLLSMVILLLPVVMAQRNILTNGDFEYGAGGFEMWNWPRRAGYKTVLSDESYSGKYSLTLTCEKNCDPGDGSWRGGFFTMPIVGDGEYFLSFYAKGNGPSLWIQAEAVDGGKILEGNPRAVRRVISNKWQRYGAVFVVKGPFRLYFYSSGKGTVWVDKVVLRQMRTPKLPVPTPREEELDSRFDSEGYLCIDQKRFFPIAIYNDAEKNVATLKKMGFNTLVTPPFEWFNYARGIHSHWDKAAHHGMYVFPELSSVARSRDARPFHQYIKDYKGHPAVLGWYLDDEPDHSNLDLIVIEPQTLKSQYQAIKKQSRLPIGVDYQVHWRDPGDPDQKYVPIKEYHKAHDFFMFEPYPSIGDKLSVYENIIGYTRQVDARQPVWFIHIGYRDLTWQLATMYMSIIQGGKGLVFFHYEDEIAKDPTLLANVRAAVHEANILQPVFLAKEAAKITCSHEQIEFIAKEYQKRIYIIALNRQKQDIEATFHGIAGEVKVLFENRSLGRVSAKLRDHFNGYQRHVYEVVAR